MLLSLPLPRYGLITHGSTWWWLSGGLIVLGVMGLISLARAGRGRQRAAARAATLAGQRDEAVSRLASVERRWQADTMSSADALTQVSAIVRRFIGIVEDSDEDFRSVAELDNRAGVDSRFAAAAELVAECVRQTYDPAATPDVPAALNSASEVITTWH